MMELARVEESNSGPIVIPNSLIYGDDVVDTVFVSRLYISIESTCFVNTKCHVCTR